MEYEYMGLTDKQYDGMIKDAIYSLDRLAKITKDKDMLKAIYEERQCYITKLGYDVDENDLYTSIKQ